MDWTTIKVPVSDPSFPDALNAVRRIHQTHFAYRVYAMKDGARWSVPRICETDRDGILYIGKGGLSRVQRLASDMLKGGSQHDLGRKLHAIHNDLGRSPLPKGFELFMEVIPCTEADALNFEGHAQLDYRKRFGENPPYSGRWEFPHEPHE